MVRRRSPARSRSTVAQRVSAFGARAAQAQSYVRTWRAPTNSDA